MARVGRLVGRGESGRAQLEAPNVLITGITNRWRETANQLPVADKKEAFYRFLLPLILHANDLVMKRRGELQARGCEKLAEGMRLDDRGAAGGSRVCTDSARPL